MKRFAFISVLSLLSLIVLAPVVLAQSPTTQAERSPQPTRGANAETPAAGISLKPSPTYLSLSTDPGKEVSSQIKITNNNVFTESLRLGIMRIEAGANGGGPVIVEVEKDDPFVQWVEFSEEEFTLAARETKTIKVTVNTPEEAALGYYYAVVVNRVNEQQEQVQGGAAVAGSPAIPMLLNVKSPNAKKELQILDFTTDQYVYEYLPATFRVSVRNSGNIHIVPVGDIFLDWGGKQDIEVLRVNEGNGNVLPQTTRTFDSTWNDSMVLRTPKVENGRPVLGKNGQPEMTTTFDFDKPLSKFRIGKYTARALLVYDNGERDVPVEASVSFWVIPWKLIAGAVLVILAPFLLFIFINKLRKRGRK